MFKYLIITLFFLVTTLASTNVVNLRLNNFVVLRGPIDGKKASIVVNELVSLKTNEIYLYLDSPGGSVMAGLQIVQAIESLQLSGVKVYTIANNVASMAFIVHQTGTKRYIRPWSILMQHQMSYGSEGPYHNVKAHEKLMDKLYEQLMEKQAERANINLEQFDNLTEHDMWLLGKESIEKNFADEVIDVICDFEPSTFQDNFKVLWFDVTTVYSTCPLANKPLHIEVNGNATNEEHDEIMRSFDTEYQIFKLRI